MCLMRLRGAFALSRCLLVDDELPGDNEWGGSNRAAGTSEIQVRYMVKLVLAQFLFLHVTQNFS